MLQKYYDSLSKKYSCAKRVWAMKIKNMPKCMRKESMPKSMMHIKMRENNGHLDACMRENNGYLNTCQ
jgi:hypothetical protein